MTQEINITEEQIGLLSGLIPDKKGCTDIVELTEHKFKLTLAVYEQSDIFDGLEMAGWKMVGQTIVYGFEKILGFSGSAELCAQVERNYKAMKRKKDVNIPRLRLIFTEHFLRILFPEHNKIKVNKT